MTALEKAQKKYWYDRGFNKWDSGCVANTELCVFAEGWRAALEMALTKETDLQQTELGYAIRKELEETE